jgi:outer membrane protein assembly factor BamA
MLLLLPKVAVNPINGILLGGTGALAWRFGPKETTRVSLAGLSIGYSTKNQFISHLQTNIYTRADRFFLQGDFRLYFYNAPTWGLGTNSPQYTYGDYQWTWVDPNDGTDVGAYQMKYNFLRIHEIVSYKIRKFFYLGMGYHIDYFFDIHDDQLDLNAVPQQLTPHYTYSIYHGFRTDEYMMSGLSLNVVYDSRDNMNNPYKGYYVNVNYRINATFLGSDQRSSSLYLEFRAYKHLSQRSRRHLLGFWAFGNIQTSGVQPYLALPAAGEDQRSRSGRGYIAGRFRGESFFYSELEYRFPFCRWGKILGGVAFVNISSASNKVEDIPLFKYIKPGYGFGIRFMLNKNFRTNINIDFAFGHKSNAVYFSSNETF